MGSEMTGFGMNLVWALKQSNNKVAWQDGINSCLYLFLADHRMANNTEFKPMFRLLHKYVKVHAVGKSRLIFVLVQHLCFQTGIQIFLFTDVFITWYRILKDLLFIFKHTKMYTFYVVLNHASPSKDIGWNWLKMFWRFIINVLELNTNVWNICLLYKTFYSVSDYLMDDSQSKNNLIILHVSL